MKKIKVYLHKTKDGTLQEYIRQTKWIYGYGKMYWKAMIFYTVLGMSGVAVSLISGLISRDMVDIITGHKTGMLIKTFITFIIFGIGNVIISQISSYFSNKISISVDNEIKADVFEKIIETDIESLQNYHTGDLLTRWSSDAGTISSGILNFIPNLIINIVKFISTLAIVMFNDPIFALLALMGMPVSIIMSKTLLKRMTDNNKRSAAMGAKMSGFNQETFSNIQTIKSFNLIELYIKRLKQIQKDYIEMKLEFQKLSMFTAFLMSVVGMAVSYSCYGFGIYRVWSGAISYGTMTMFLSFSGSLTGTLNSLMSAVPQAISMCTSAGRLMDILEMPREDYSDASKAEEFLNKNRKNGLHVSLENIDYSYKNGNEIFEKCCFEAHPNETVAIVGPSGEGKTTLFRIILSLVFTNSGNLMIYSVDKNNNMKISPSTRQFFSYVPQGNSLFSGSIAENMRNVKEDATEDEIVEALKMACAWDFVKKLPNGIYSKVGERGAGFSEGQAQRLSIARALIRKSPILLLDEATSALDNETEKRLLENIRNDRYPRTCIITTHRLAVLDVCTKVYRIQDKKCKIVK